MWQIIQGRAAEVELFLYLRSVRIIIIRASLELLLFIVPDLIPISVNFVQVLAGQLHHTREAAAGHARARRL